MKIKNTTEHIIDMPGVLGSDPVTGKRQGDDLKIAPGGVADVTAEELAGMKVKPAIANYFAAGHLVEVEEESALASVEG